MKKNLLGYPVLDKRRIVVDKEDGVGMVSGEFKEAKWRAFAC